MSAPANASTAMARTVVDTMLALGVRHAVLAPGSRSAALAFALHDAAAQGRLTLHTRIDEGGGGVLPMGRAITSRSSDSRTSAASNRRGSSASAASTPRAAS